MFELKWDLITKSDQKSLASDKDVIKGFKKHLLQNIYDNYWWKIHYLEFMSTEFILLSKSILYLMFRKKFLVQNKC